MAISRYTPTPPVRMISKRDWRCTRCFGLLGKRVGERVHLRTTRGAEYVAPLPITAVCRCGN